MKVTGGYQVQLGVGFLKIGPGKRERVIVSATSPAALDSFMPC